MVWWGEENRRGVKVGTAPQCFLLLAPQRRNIIVNISSELLALIQTLAAVCLREGVEQQGSSPSRTHTHTHAHHYCYYLHPDHLPSTAD